MHNWHAQITSLTIRMFKDGKSFENKDEYSCVVQAELFSDNSAYLHAALKQDGSEISFKEWVTLFILLHKDYGIENIKFERRGKEVTMNIHRFLRK